jgi:hypothetical protein
MTPVVKIFTMQKDEDDILQDWIEYHAKIVGFDNIFIIDNHSGRKSLDILDHYATLGVHISYEDDYAKKGDLIYKLIVNNPCDYAVPLDLDEFIGLHIQTQTNAEVIADPSLICQYFQTLCDSKPHNRFSFRYYLTSINNQLRYQSPLSEITCFHKIDNGHSNKKFFSGSSGNLLFLDHGNHSGSVKDYTQNEYFVTDLILYHFHYRGVYKLIEKCKNDILGLKHINNINNIEELQKQIKDKVLGSHNMQTYLKYRLYGAYSLIELPSSNTITNTSLSKYFISSFLENAEI